MNILYKKVTYNKMANTVCKRGASLVMGPTKWPNLALADYFQISHDSSFQDAGEEINNVLYRGIYSLRNKNIEFKSES